MTRRASTLLTGVLVFAALLGLTFAHVPVRYVALEPGPTYNTLGKSGGKELITITGAKTTDSKGQLRMLTVYEVGAYRNRDYITMAPIAARRRSRSRMVLLLGDLLE